LILPEISERIRAQQSTIDNHQMPNHNNNQLKLESGQDILNVLNPYIIQNDENDYTFDFQKIIPMDANKGVYMIAYSDNFNALLQKKYLENTLENRNLYCDLLEESLGIPKGALKIIAIKDYYWPIGTHYYEPLKGPYRTRNEFVNKAQHPENGMLVVGEVVSRYTGWTEGALKSVEAVLTKKWVKDEC
jgi:hypothetical protein